MCACARTPPASQADFQTRFIGRTEGSDPFVPAPSRPAERRAARTPPSPPRRSGSAPSPRLGPARPCRRRCLARPSGLPGRRSPPRPPAVLRCPAVTWGRPRGPRRNAPARGGEMRAQPAPGCPRAHLKHHFFVKLRCHPPAAMPPPAGTLGNGVRPAAGGTFPASRPAELQLPAGTARPLPAGGRRWGGGAGRGGPAAGSQAGRGRRCTQSGGCGARGGR